MRNIWTLQILIYFQQVLCKKAGKCAGPNPFTCYEWGSSSSCFPASAKVSLYKGKSMAMSDLNIGDQVKTG